MGFYKDKNNFTIVLSTKKSEYIYGDNVIMVSECIPSFCSLKIVSFSQYTNRSRNSEASMIFVCKLNN